MRPKLVKETIKINGIKVQTVHSSLAFLPKEIVSLNKTSNNRQLHKLANEVVKF